MSTCIPGLSSKLQTHLPNCISDIPLGTSKALKPSMFTSDFIILCQQTGPYPGCLSQGRAQPFSQLCKSETWKSLRIPPSPPSVTSIAKAYCFYYCISVLNILVPVTFVCFLFLLLHGHYSGLSNYHLLSRFLQVPSYQYSHPDPSPSPNADPSIGRVILMTAHLSSPHSINSFKGFPLLLKRKLLNMPHGLYGLPLFLIISLPLSQQQILSCHRAFAHAGPSAGNVVPLPSPG